MLLPFTNVLPNIVITYFSYFLHYSITFIVIQKRLISANKLKSFFRELFIVIFVVIIFEFIHFYRKNNFLRMVLCYKCHIELILYKEIKINSIKKI